MDLDKPHRGDERHHVHKWNKDGNREHPGREYFPVPVKWQFGVFLGGVMNLAEYIECEFDGISIAMSNGGRDVRVSIQKHSGERVILIAKNVGYFVLDNMRLRNFIEEIVVFDGSNIKNSQQEVEGDIFYLLQGREREEKENSLLFGYYFSVGSRNTKRRKNPN